MLANFPQTGKDSGEDRIMWLLRDSKVPVFDIVVWWIHHEKTARKLRNHRSLELVFLEQERFHVLLQELRWLYLDKGQELVQELGLTEGLRGELTMFDVVVHPCLISPAMQEVKPECSWLITHPKATAIGEVTGI